MNLPDDIHKVYMIGIGGIGMSSLARYFVRHHMVVSGYDRTSSKLTKELVSEGIQLYYEPDAGHIDSDTGLVIYTPAVPASHPELQWARSSDIPVMKRSEALGAICSGQKTIAVAGTHGKTTTTAMIGHLLASSGKKVTVFLGGISANYDNNFISTGDDGFFVVEADEYDRSFLKLNPHLAVITSMRADHLDIYGDEKSMMDSFCQFADRVDPQGTIILHRSLDIGNPSAEILWYGNETGDGVSAFDIQIRNASFHFKLKFDGADAFNIVLQVPGLHNVENAVAAASVARLAGLSTKEIQYGLSSFRGVKRRFEYIIKNQDLVLIDDYAHHPDELHACISTARALYPGKRITGVFQPHLFSRTRDLADGFAASLALLDQLFLLDIYPAREEPIDEIDAHWLLDQVPIEDKRVVQKADLPEALQKVHAGVILIMGAGDIDAMVPLVKEKLLGL